MGSAKDEVRRILEQIPDNASFEDIQYHIYVREKIDRGLEDVEQGRVICQEEVERRMRKWTGEWSGLKPPGMISSR
jgi:predicted transcriptional regulator